MAKEKQELEWEGCKLSFFEDLMKELVEKWRAFNIVKKHLVEKCSRQHSSSLGKEIEIQSEIAQRLKLF